MGVVHRRTVRLTVLPAANSTTNTTISHDGLLEVQSTIQSVEQDARTVDSKQVTEIFVQHSINRL